MTTWTHPPASKHTLGTALQGPAVSSSGAGAAPARFCAGWYQGPGGGQEHTRESHLLRTWETGQQLRANPTSLASSAKIPVFSSRDRNSRLKLPSLIHTPISSAATALEGPAHTLQTQGWFLPRAKNDLPGKKLR